MTREQFISEFGHLVDNDGVFKNDTRFRLSFNERRGELTATMITSGEVFIGTSPRSILSWMLTQPPPAGSLRIGNVVSRATRAVGIAPCSSCLQRQLQYNNKFKL